MILDDFTKPRIKKRAYLEKKVALYKRRQKEYQHEITKINCEMLRYIAPMKSKWRKLSNPSFKAWVFNYLFTEEKQVIVLHYRGMNNPAGIHLSVDDLLLNWEPICALK